MGFVMAIRETPEKGENSLVQSIQNKFRASSQGKPVDIQPSKHNFNKNHPATKWEIFVGPVMDFFLK